MPSAMCEKSIKSRAHKGGRCSTCGSLNRMREISTAERTKLLEVRMNTVLRPNDAASSPPRAEPTASVNDQVIEERLFATSFSSSVDVIFGITELRAGSNIAQP